MRHSDDRLDQVDAMRDEMGAERVRLGDINQDLTDRLRRLEERDVLSRRVQQAEAQAATLQTAARQAYDDATRLNVSLGEAVARMTVAEAECDEARDALTAERDRRVASEAALATAQARLDDTRAALDKLEEVADRERQGTAEIARRLSLAEATLMAERGLVWGTREAGHPQQKPPVNNRMPGELAAARSRGVPDAANGTTPKRLADPPQSGKRRSDLS